MLGFLWWFLYVGALCLILVAWYFDTDLVPQLTKNKWHLDDNGTYTMRLATEHPDWINDIVILLIAVVVCISAPVIMLVILALWCLAIGAHQDWKTCMVSESLLLIIVAVGLAVGVRTGHAPSAVTATLIIILYDVILGDPDEFGSADMLVIMSALAGFGICALPIFLLISCACGLLIKLILWVTKKHKTEDHSVTFLPSLLVGAISTLFIDAAFGSYYTVSLSELLWLFDLR